MGYEIWHNPRCSKSRAALEIMEGAGVELRVVRYLETPPDPARLAEVLAALGMEPADLVRPADARAAGLEFPLRGARRDLIELMSANPALIERPVVIAPDGRAVLGRPPERVRQLL